MTPAAAIAALDRQIAAHGEDVFLRDQDAADDGTGDMKRRAFVRGYKPDELAGGVQQGDSTAVLSPTGLGVDPKRLGGIIIGGRYRTIEVANPVRLNGVVVRVELWVRG